MNPKINHKLRKRVGDVTSTGMHPRILDTGPQRNKTTFQLDCRLANKRRQPPQALTCKAARESCRPAFGKNVAQATAGALVVDAPAAGRAHIDCAEQSKFLVSMQSSTKVASECRAGQPFSLNASRAKVCSCATDEESRCGIPICTSMVAPCSRPLGAS